MTRLEELREKYAPNLDPEPWTCLQGHDYHRFAEQGGYSISRSFHPRPQYEQNREAYNVTPQ